MIHNKKKGHRLIVTYTGYIKNKYREGKIDKAT